MSKRNEYRQTLRGLDDWDPYLLAESGLPGPRGNIELAQAVADEGDVRWIMRQNLAKQRLARLDAKRVAAWQARISLLTAIERSSGAWSDENHPELKTDEDIDRYVRQLRESWISDQLAST